MLPIQTHKIGILPFQNLNSKNDDFISQAVTDEIIRTLNKIDYLEIITEKYFHSTLQSENKTTTEATYLVKGDLKRAKNKLELFVQIIYNSTGHQIQKTKKSFVIDNELEVLFSIANTTVEFVLTNLFGFCNLDNHKQSPTSYENFMLSKQNFHLFTRENLLTASLQIEKTLKQDAHSSTYYSAKSLYFAFLGNLNIINKHLAYNQAHSSALKALSMDAKNAEGYLAMSVLEVFQNKNIDVARKYAHKALLYRPQYSEASIGLAMLACFSNQLEKAMGHVLHAMSLDPMSIFNQFYFALIQKFSGNYKSSIVITQKILTLNPFHTPSYCLQGINLIELKEYEKAITHFKKVPSSNGKLINNHDGLAITYAYLKDQEKAYFHLKASDSRKFNLPHWENPNVIVEILFGNYEKAFDLIEEDFKQKKHYLMSYKINPVFEVLKTQKRYTIFKKYITDNDISFEQRNSTEKYKKASLHPDDQQLIYKRLKTLMEDEKYFLQEEKITLNKLSKKLNISSNNISQVINVQFGDNLYAFVNYYKLLEFERLQKKDSNKKFKQMVIAHNAGFNSKATFYRVYKKFFNCLPKNTHSSNPNRPNSNMF